MPYLHLDLAKTYYQRRSANWRRAYVAFTRWPLSKIRLVGDRNPEAADRCRPKDRRRRTTPGTGTEPPPARTRPAFSLTFRVGLYPLSGWCRAPRRPATTRAATDLKQKLFRPPISHSVSPRRRGPPPTALPRVPAGAELGAGAELPGRPQPPGLRQKSCSAPTSS